MYIICNIITGDNMASIYRSESAPVSLHMNAPHTQVGPDTSSTNELSDNIVPFVSQVSVPSSETMAVELTDAASSKNASNAPTTNAISSLPSAAPRRGRVSKFAPKGKSKS